ncbi:hypothetical protein M0813_02746 [Anaeramoeba flamelloides]|uniref:Uncharacterized protein n=1 Tax=Anaeramoeba flamelloides TaxID=1746091 RepID=A0ABQ8YE84_9EUKA|nr:hypothetical protein M0813_02746 [Anaeramoeba flamelloides]
MKNSFCVCGDLQSISVSEEKPYLCMCNQSLIARRVLGGMFSDPIHQRGTMEGVGVRDDIWAPVVIVITLLLYIQNKTISGIVIDISVFAQKDIQLVILKN